MTYPIEIARSVLAAQSFSVLLGTVMTAFDEAGVELQLPVTGQLLQQHGFVHGGVLAYLADNALTYAAALPMGEVFLQRT